MRLPRLATLVAAGALLALPGQLHAHGGQYRGPGDTVPPNPGGGGGRTGGPGGPTTPGPGGPTTPTPGGPTTPGPNTPPPSAPTGGPASGRGPTTGGPGGVAQGDDLSQWQFWWEFNKDPFLNLKHALHEGAVVSGSDDFDLGRGKRKDAVSTLAPSISDKKNATEALKWGLDDKDSNRDIISSCMVALAKIGLDKDILPLFKAHLPDKDQEQSETAAVAMGIANLPEAVPDLLELAKDSQVGRKIVENDRVPFRTRSFACYGLGLIAYSSKDNKLKAKIYEAMHALVADESMSNRDIKIAALNAIRLLRPNTESEEGKTLHQKAVEFLSAYMMKKKGNQQIQSHAVTALAALVGRGDRFDPKGTYKAMILEILKDRRKRTWMDQSAVLALGEMATPEDEEISKALQEYFKRGRDEQAKNFCGIALGQIGGAKNRDFLVTTLRKKRTKSISKPWLALGIAVEDYNMRQKDPNYAGSAAAREAILREFKSMRNNLFAAGLAIAMGILRYQDAGPDILDRLLRYKNQDQPAGYFAVALGLMNYKEAKNDINDIVEGALRRDILLTQGSIALGLLGDKTIGGKLIERMKSRANVVAVQSALAQAIGFIGDKNSVRPLIEMLHDKSYRDIPRAFAAVALGLVCDKEEFPWNSKIAVGANYRANVETLTGAGTGILDIL